MKTFAFARAVAVASGLANLLTGFALIFAPQWFFDNIGTFPPYNRHFLGDVGVFLFPLGIGLLWAARDPLKHRSLIGVAAMGSALHVFNHLYDDFASGELGPLFFSNTLPLVVLAVLLLAAYFGLARQPDESKVLPA